MRVQLIHNPESGSHHEMRLDILMQAFAACGAETILGETCIDGDTLIRSDCDLICVSGGDGTLGLVVSSMINSGSTMPLCVFPAGTVNLIAREIGYAADPELFAREVMQGYFSGPESWLHEPVARSDIGPFVACLSAGPDGVAVARHSPEFKKRFGKIAYVTSLLKLFFGWPRHAFKLAIQNADGNSRRLACAAFYVAKGRYFAGSWALAPDATLGNDGYFLITLSAATRSSFVRFMAHVALGRDPAGLPFVDSQFVRSINIETADQDGAAIAFQVDGDSMPDAPSRIYMTGQAVRYCLPRKA